MRLYSFRCPQGHVFDEFASDPSPRPCRCGSLATRRFCPPHLILRPYEARMSQSLATVVRSERDFREKLKEKSEKDQREYEVIDDISEWAEVSRIDGIRVERDRLVYDGGQKELDVEFEDADDGEVVENLKPSRVLAEELHEHYS